MHAFDSDHPGFPDAQLGDSELRTALAQDRVMAILRYRGGGDVSAAIEGLHRGGIRVLEVTVDTPGGWEAIAAVTDQPGLVVGAGTITDADQVRRLADLGGRFIVSPGFDATVVEAALERGLEVLPGIATGTEVLAARRAGAQLFKLFPAGALGTPYLQQLRGPFSREAFVPTGGVGIGDIAAWLAAGAFAVALGSDLAGRTPPASVQDTERLTLRARTALTHARHPGCTSGVDA